MDALVTTAKSTASTAWRVLPKRMEAADSMFSFLERTFLVLERLPVNRHSYFWSKDTWFAANPEC
ncbi:MAG TPA: hypothetical protein DFS52_00670 [Myxococcales bacterium]|jgi:hypothetical protein|nr:hypothetical protein [Myxococcales bacterium]